MCSTISRILPGYVSRIGTLSSRPGDELLDHEPGRVGFEQLVDAFEAGSAILDHRVLGHSLGRTFGVGLDDQWETQVVGNGAVCGCHQDALRNPDAAGGDHGLGEVLVEVHVEQRRVAAGVRETQLFEEPGVESLPRAADRAFGDVEDEVWRTLEQPLDDLVRLAGDLHRGHPVAQLSKRPDNAVDVGLGQQARRWPPSCRFADCRQR